MTAPNSENASTIGHSPSRPSSRRLRWLAFIVVFSLLIALISFALLLLPFSPRRQLTEKERQLLGAWEIQAESGAKAIVLYFDDRRGMRLSSPPFTKVLFCRWHVDENNHLHSRHEGLMETVLNIHQAPLDCEVRFSEGSMILKTADGADHVLTRYSGAGLQTMKESHQTTQTMWQIDQI